LTIPDKERWTLIDYKELVPKLKNKLEKEGYNIAVGTIRKYVHEGLTDKPTVYYLGQGKGKRSEYEDQALGELYAAWKLLNGPIQTSLDRLKEISNLARKIYKVSSIEVECSITEKLKLNWRDLAYLMELWINYCEEMRVETTFYRVEIGHLTGLIEDEKMKMFLVKPPKFTRTRTDLDKLKK